jgi:alpha-tubulin suppressor-like RCC1 family protein
VAKSSPTLIDDTEVWLAIAAGHTHTCGLATSGLFCWGDGGSGQLGIGSAGLQLEPKSVSAPTAGGSWTAVAVGAAHTCALESASSGVTLWCWGSSEFSANGGDSGGEDVEVPVQVGGDTDWSSITAGDWHTCGLRGTNLYCWGRDEAGQVGNGNGAEPVVSSPALVGTGPWASAAAGSQHTCAIDAAADALYCWGSDDSGQVGNGNTTPDQASPVSVDSSATWSAVSTGGSHTCALESSGRGRSCWGSNEVGQLGVGEATTLLDAPSSVVAGPWDARSRWPLTS